MIWWTSTSLNWSLLGCWSSGACRCLINGGSIEQERRRAAVCCNNSIWLSRISTCTSFKKISVQPIEYAIACPTSAFCAVMTFI